MSHSFPIHNCRNFKTSIQAIFLIVTLVIFNQWVYAEKKPLVVSSTTMVKDLVNQIGGDAIDSRGLMGAGIDPHYYRATFNDMRLLRRANIVFYNGLGLEGRMISVFNNLSAIKPTYALAEKIPSDQLILLDGIIDPHIWLSVPLWRQVAWQVYQKLSEYFPQHQAYFLKNYQQFESELNEIHDWITLEINHLPEARRKLVTAHDAFNYYGQTYGLDVIAIQGLNTEVEFGLAALQRVKTLIIEWQIPAVFIESTIPNRSINALINGLAAEGIELKLGGELLADALGLPNEKNDTYQGMMRHNTRTIVDALK